MPTGAELAWLLALVMTAVAGTMLAAAFLLMRDSLSARRRADALEGEVERLGDVIWDLRESEERTRSLIDGQGDLIVRRDGRGRITFVNQAFARLAGRERDGLIGSEFSFTVVDKGQSKVQSEDHGKGQPETRDGAVVRRDEAIETAEGRRWIEWQDVPVRGNGRGRPETQSVGRDVTARKQAEDTAERVRDAAEAANSAKSRFLATVTHEIRTPLGGILGMADLLHDTGLTPEQTTYAKAVKSSGETLLSLIDEILDFSKIEAGRLDLEEAPFDLTALIEDVTELLAPRAHAKGLEIAAHVSASLPRRFVGDAGRLKQVLLNLAGNAVKFTEAGGLVLRVGRDGPGIRFEVEDTGIGIAPDKASLIFNEFEQADSTPSRRFGGTGLGLAISKRIVERMGGAIILDSTPGAGSTFRFTLPLSVAGEGPVRPSRRAARQRVLVATPSPVLAEALVAMLADLGMEGAVAASPSDAATRAVARDCDVVLVDRAFGAEATADLARKAASERLRVVALLAPAERHELAHLAASGAGAYLIKPVRTASLLAQVAGGAPPVPANDDAAAMSAPLAGLSVLLAEDNEVNALVARTVLSRLGAHVAWARDGKEAVEAHRAERFDAILMDMHMPGLDGPGATRAIRTAEEMSGAARTPVYALTANAQDEDRAICFAAGMDRFLTKPLDRDELARLLAPPLPPARSA